MSDTLHRLTKEIDALTYNARSILNALNRSVLIGSSTNGFTVNRVGQTIQLTRPLIYRLYRFYQEWENKQFNQDDFTTLLTAQDLIPVTDENGQELISSPTSQAIIRHSKILYLNETTAALSDSAWIELVRTANNPKLITNSAPVPLNLRTPIFDENLSTTRFLTHESYLFPYAYFALDTLGYSGDGVRHILAGLSWDIDADEYVRIKAPKISLGNLIEDAPLKTIDRREGENSLSWGFDTHARGFGSTAGGNASSAISSGSVAIGHGLQASAVDSVALGGITNNAVSVNSGVFAGGGNNAIGGGSVVLGGVFNVSGDDVFPFDFESLEGGVLNRSSILVTGNLSVSFLEGDSVKLFDFTTPGTTDHPAPNVFFENNGDVYESVESVISSSSYNSGTNKTKITINAPVPYETTVGGKISVSFYGLNRQTGTRSTFPGLRSLVTGEGNRAIGTNQTVVGRYNKKAIDALFIVGTGTATTRKNGFIVKDGLPGTSSSEVFAFGISPTGSDMIDDPLSYGLNVNNTRALLKAGNSYVNIENNNIEIKTGTATSRIILTPSTGSTVPDIISLILSSTGGTETAQLRLRSINSGFEQSTLLRAKGMDIVATEGRIVIGTKSTTVGQLDIFSGFSTIPSGFLGGIRVSSISNLNFVWSNPNNVSPFNSTTESLVLSGKTFGALPTTDKQYCHLMHDNLWYNRPPSLAPTLLNLNNVIKSGFYYTKTTDGDVIGNNWLLNFGLYNGNDLTSSTEGETLQIIFPINSDFLDSISIPNTERISVRRFRKGGTGPAGNKDTGAGKPLAWLSDVTGGASILNQTTLQTGANFNIDGNGTMSGDLKVGNNSFLGANTVISSDYIYGTITGFRNIVLPLTTNPVLTGRNISGNNNIIIGSVLTSNSGNIILGRGAGKLILESGDPGSGETAFPARILNQASSEVSFNVEQASSGILTITSPGSFTNVPTNGSGFSAASTSQTFTLTHVNCKSNDIILLTVRRLSGGTNIGFGAMLLNITEDVNGGNITFKFTSNADATDTDASLPDLTLYWVVIGTTGSLT